MQTSDLREYLIIGVILLIAAAWVSLTVGHHKRGIRGELERRRAQNIRIIWMPLLSDKTSHTYWVTYDDAELEPHSTICRIRVWDSVIYWKDK